ncbi:MAG: plasmid stabilization protein [Planctomycetes bacterium]|nr:plasmid stabilization protein [Planctomycetota bacterium]
MAQEFDPNKISDKERRRASQIKEKLQRQGVGEDEAAKRAVQQAAEELQSGQGGGKNRGGESPKGADQRKPEYRG